MGKIENIKILTSVEKIQINKELSRFSKEKILFIIETFRQQGYIKEVAKKSDYTETVKNIKTEILEIKEEINNISKGSDKTNNMIIDIDKKINSNNENTLIPISSSKFDIALFILALSFGIIIGYLSVGIIYYDYQIVGMRIFYWCLSSCIIGIILTIAAYKFFKK